MATLKYSSKQEEIADRLCSRFSHSALDGKDFPSVSDILGSDWAAHLPEWRGGDAAEYRARAYKVAEQRFGPLPWKYNPDA